MKAVRTVDTENESDATFISCSLGLGRTRYIQNLPLHQRYVFRLHLAITYSWKPSLTQCECVE